MVGIAKKDYCANCRRRRVKCDRTRPACLKCVKGGRICEGYDRFPVFLNRTQQGLERREALEDVKPITPKQFHENHAAHQPSFPLSSSPPMQGSEYNVFDMQFVTIFLQDYLPLPSSKSSKLPDLWIKDALVLPEPSKSLQLSLQALCRSRAGLVRNDEVMHRAGRATYAKALGEFQNNLRDENIVRTDATLATARAFSLYELLQPTTPDAKAFANHQSGMAALIKLRGVGSFKTLLPRAVFEDVRMTFAYRAIQFRKSCFLGSEKWATIPWDMGEKPPVQSLYDIFFVLADLLEQVDKVTMVTSSQGHSQQFLKLLARCRIVDHQLLNWHREFVYPKPDMYWENHQSGIVDQILPNKNATYYADYEFSNITNAQMMMSYWGIQIKLYETVDFLCQKSENTHDKECESRISLSKWDSDALSPTQMVEQYKLEYPKTLQTQAAFNVVRTLDYCFDTRMGTFGPQSTLFGIAVAFQTLQDHSGEMLDRCSFFYDRLMSNKGVPHAQSLKN